MTDKQIAALFMSVLLPAFQTIAGLETVKLARSYQHRQHGTPTTPYIYFFKVTDHRHGFAKRSDIYNTTDADFDHGEIQQYEATYQFSAWTPQQDNDTTSMTESDMLDTVASLMQSDAIIEAFRSAGVGILRVTDVRNPYITDDRDQFAAIPTFDIGITYRRILTAKVPAVADYLADIHRV